MIAPGTRFGHLVVIEEITATEAGHPKDGSWCRVKCDCGIRKKVRSRHLRGTGYARIVSCGRAQWCPFALERLIQGATTTNAARLKRRALLSGKQAEVAA